MELEYDVFLSHKGDDKPEVELLGTRLNQEAGLRPFLDKWQLPIRQVVAAGTRERHRQERLRSDFLRPTQHGSLAQRRD
jgi:hypothetical protein